MTSVSGNHAADPAGNTRPSAFAPFRYRAFALLWTATLISNIGTWMHAVSAAWLMTSLSPSPMVVAMVQAATSGAMALVALPAGAMADRHIAFRDAMHRLAEQRRRYGAYQWGLMQDAADPERFIEYFLVESWLEQERQHARVARADADLQAEIRAFAKSGTVPRITHWLAS